MSQAKTIEQIAERILDQNPDPVVRFRLLRDVLRAVPDADDVIRARQRMLRSRWVLQLKSEQQPDGGWGRFHSIDTKSSQKVPTTEAAVERGLALGLSAADPVFRGTALYLLRLLEGSTHFPDPAERNDRWTTGTQLFAAAALARLLPDLPALDKIWNLWATVATCTLASGDYDPRAEIDAHQALTGASVKSSYLALDNRYTLSLLASRATRLPDHTEAAIVSWLWHKDGGLGYLGVALSDPPDVSAPGQLDRWLTSLELLSSFPSCRQVARDAADWIWARTNDHGFWDFGPRSSTSCYFPLSETWRRNQSRRHDWSTRILALLRRYCDSP